MGFLKACLFCLAFSMACAILVSAASALWPLLGVAAIGLIWWFLLSGHRESGKKDYRGGDYEDR